MSSFKFRHQGTESYRFLLSPAWLVRSVTRVQVHVGEEWDSMWNRHPGDFGGFQWLSRTRGCGGGREKERRKEGRKKRDRQKDRQ